MTCWRAWFAGGHSIISRLRPSAHNHLLANPSKSRHPVRRRDGGVRSPGPTGCRTTEPRRDARTTPSRPPAALAAVLSKDTETPRKIVLESAVGISGSASSTNDRMTGHPSKQLRLGDCSERTASAVLAASLDFIHVANKLSYFCRQRFLHEEPKVVWAATQRTESFDHPCQHRCVAERDGKSIVE